MFIVEFWRTDKINHIMKNLYPIFRNMVSAFMVILLTSLVCHAQGFSSITNLNSLSISAITGEKPQSKVWTYDGKWWMVMPNSAGTQIWRLDGTTWTSVLNIDASTSSYADCKVMGSVTHILLYKGTSSSLVSVEYVPGSSTYQLWTTRPSSVSLTLASGVETAVIDVDGNGRMWLAYAGTTEVYVRWSDAPYSSWSSDISIATGINDDDICAVTVFGGNIGVLWSNQNTKRFGFKYHSAGADPSSWSSEETPPTTYNPDYSAGMADDHLNFAAATDGTVYAAVKTSWDAAGYPRIGMLVRRPAGSWDNLYGVSESGTRGIVVLNEAAGKIKVIYTSSESGGNILYKESSTSAISFGSENTLMSGTYNNPTTTKQSYPGEIVIMAANTSGTSLAGVLATDTNVNSYALDFDGTNDYVDCGTSASADITGPITLEAWVRSDGAATQSIVKKNGTGSGYELSLSNNVSGGLPQNYFFRLNGSDTYRVNSTSYYPIDGTWAHVAATYDGSVMRLYVNGVQEGGNVPGPASIATNSNNLVIGTDAATPGTGKNFNGGIDEVRIWNVARTAQEIQDSYQKQLSSGYGLVGRWGMAEGTGTSTANSVAGGLNGTLMDGTVVGNGPLWITGTPFSPPSIPASPVLVSPANGSAGVSVSPTLSWNASSGATSYRVQVSTDNNFSSIVYDQSGITSTTTSVSGLLNGTLYYWHVNATNGSGTSGWSSAWSFTTVVAIPPVEDNGSGYALDFDGTNGSALSDYVNCGNSSVFNIDQSITIEAWVKPTSTKTHSIVKKYNITNSGYELFLENATNGRISFRLNGSNRVNSTTYYNQPLSTWIHVAATYDYATKLMKIFVNGREEGSITGPASIVTNSSALIIGAELTDYSKSFQGVIDEVRIWNIARTANDIQSNMCRKLSGTEPGLVGYWRFDETSGTVMNDETSNNNDGTMINMDPATDHVWSGAALGDASSCQYVASGTATATISYGSLGEQFKATTSSGTNIGVQVYRADDNALRRDATVPAGYIADPDRYWGIKVNRRNAPTFSLEYNYSGNTHVTAEVESGLKLLKRASHSVNSWADASATLNTTNHTLTITGAVDTLGSEYALAIPVINPPASPSNLSVIPVSGSVLQLMWTDNSTDETGFEIERSETGSGGPFTLITTVPANEVSYSNTGLALSVNYCYRVRAVNSGGYSAYSNTACGTTTNGPITIFLQDGVNGYYGTRDTYTDNTAGSEGTVRGAELEIIQDVDPADPDERRSLLAFDLSSIPDGAVIQSAELQLYVNTEGQGFNMYRMLTSWNEAVTYASLGNRHFAPDGTDAEATINASWPGVDGYTGYITVTLPASTIQNWIDGVVVNNGWLMIASHPDDGQRERTREWSTVAERPRLTVNYLVNPPDQPELIAPVNSSTGISTSPILSVRVTDPQDQPMAVNYYGRKKEGVGDTFTLVGLPDSQSYTASELGGLPAMFDAQTQWVKDNQQVENIVFVSHFGDVVDSDIEAQWILANTTMSTLDVGASVPYGIGIGNHDATSGFSALYNTYFGTSRFEGRSYYGGHYGTDNDNNYELFSAAGMDFVIIHLEYSPSTEAIQWADGILKANPGRRAIVTSHSIIETGNPGSFSSIGQAIYDELKDNPNLFLMLCGHVPGEGRRTDTYNGSVVHTLLADYQSDPGGGNGYLRVMEFSPQTDEIYVRTYSPYLDQWITDSDSQFTLSYDMENNGFQLIGTATNIASGSEASITWNSLDSGTEYEWYVTVSNGDATVTGPVWSFTTAPQAVWTGEAGTDWASPANWAGGLYPGATNNVSIPDVTNDPVIGPTMTVDCHDLIIQPGGVLSIQASEESSGSLIVHGSASGNVTYNRTIPDDGTTQLWHYISSPVSLGSISSTKDFYPYDEVGGNWGGSTTNIQSGRGYTVIGGGTISFTGSVITSDLPVTVTSPYTTPVITGTTQEYDDRWSLNPSRGSYGGGGFNLLGNPYTSSISASLFINANDAAFDPSYKAVYLYNGNTYSYIGSPVAGWDIGNPGSLGQTHIQAGQGFFVLAMVNNTQFTFTRSMQEHSPGADLLKSAFAEDRWPGIRLDAKLGDAISSTTVVFNDKMTTSLDPGYDVGQMSSGTEVEIYTSLVSKDNNINFARQALPVTGADNIAVPIGIDCEKGGEVIFSAFDIPLGNKKFWLEDRATGIYTDLNVNTYTVTLPAKTYGTGRFFIIASTNTPTGINPVAKDPDGVRIWTANDKVIVKGKVSDRAICEMYDLYGKKLFVQKLVGGELNTISLPADLSGVYLVRVIDGPVVTIKKIAIL